MAGHSKWSNTKHRKATQDAKRDKMFTKIIRELVTAARLGGGDLNSNSRLRAVVDKALSKNMARETLRRAIARGVGSDAGKNMQTFTYEGYGPGGTAIMVQCLSDNRNRTVSAVRNAFTQYGGNMGIDGSVAYLFHKKGILSFEREDEDKIAEAALEVGAENVVTDDNGIINVYTDWEKLASIRQKLEMIGLKVNYEQISMIPSSIVHLNAETARRLFHLTEMLEDCEDVQEVFHNGKFFDKETAVLC